MSHPEEVTSEAHDVPKLVGIYKKLFTILVIVTLLGIGIAYLHMPVWLAITIALLIIFFKAAVVVELFKQLLVGRWMLLLTFGLTLFFFAGLVLLPMLNHKAHITGAIDIGLEYDMAHKPAGGHHGAGHEEESKAAPAFDSNEKPAEEHHSGH
jgi:hypothetical protein